MVAETLELINIKANSFTDRREDKSKEKPKDEFKQHPRCVNTNTNPHRLCNGVVEDTSDNNETHSNESSSSSSS